MRRAAFIALVLAALMTLPGCGEAQPRLTVAPAKRFTACASSDCGGYALQLRWSGISIAGQTGYFVYKDGTQIADVPSPPYTVYGMDCGTTFTFGVQAHDAASGLSSLQATSYTTPDCPGAGGFFGVQTIGGTANGGMTADLKRVTPSASNVTGQLTKVTMYLSPTGTAGTQTLRNVIYSDSGGNPGALLGVSDELSFSQADAGGWYDLILPDSFHVDSGSTYWMGMITGPTDNIIQFNYDTATNARAFNSNTYSSGASDPFGTPSFGNERMSVYATVAPQLAPANTARPVLSGTASVGSSLTTTDGTWSPAASSFSYQWQDCDSGGINCQYISGATSASYTVAAGDVGHTIRSVVLGINGSGRSRRTSAVSSAVPGSAPGNTVLPSITGTTTQGQTLAISNGTWTGSPTSYAYQWKDCDSSGASCVNATGSGNSCSNSGTGCNYVLTSGDVAHTMRVVVTATNASGSTPATSAQSALVVGTSAPVNTALPVVSGTTAVGSVLSTTNGTWTSGGSAATCGGGTITCTYQWQRCAPGCTNISGATASTYLLVAGDVGDTIDVVVTATNGSGSTSATSAQTATITSGGGAATCTVTVSSVSTAAADIAPGAVVCLTAGTYGGATISNSGSSGSRATLQAAPGATVTIGGLVVTGSFLTVHGLHISAGASIGNWPTTGWSGTDGVTLDHNDIYQASGCGKDITLSGDNNTIGGPLSNHVRNTVINGNKIHDTDPAGNVAAGGCEADAIYIQGWDNLTVTANEIYRILGQDAQCSGNCHDDTLQSFLNNTTTGLVVQNNYVHDNTDLQGLPFLQGDITSGVNISDNLLVRMYSGSGPQSQPGLQIGINSNGMVIRHNTYWGGTLSNINAVGTTTCGCSLALDHNIFDDFQMESGGVGAPYPNLTESNNLFRSAPWSWSPAGANDQSGVTPTFKCATAGSGGSNICGNGSAAGDDYELASNPNGIGIDWAPAAQQYGP